MELPRAAVGAIAIVLCAGHNLLDGIAPDAFGSLAWLWVLLHGAGPLAPLDASVVPVALYALLPWTGVIALGYAFGPVMTFPEGARRRSLLGLGVAGIAPFFLVRGINGYDDSHPWSAQSTPLATALSFVNTEKYPPSLAFLSMTLAPSIALLGVLERAPLLPDPHRRADRGGHRRRSAGSAAARVCIRSSSRRTRASHEDGKNKRDSAPKFRQRAFCSVPPRWKGRRLSRGSGL